MADKAVIFVTYSLELQLWQVTSDQTVQNYLAHTQLTVVISSRTDFSVPFVCECACCGTRQPS